MVEEVLQLVTKVRNDGDGTTTNLIERSLGKLISGRAEQRGLADLAELGGNIVGTVALDIRRSAFSSSSDIPRRQCSSPSARWRGTWRSDRRRPWRQSTGRREDLHRP